MNLLILCAGFILLFAGGETLVRGAVSLARHFGISPLIIGVTIVGFGTSAPELAVVIDAQLLGRPGITAGNVIGSNLANLMLILGAAALVRPVRITPDAIRRDGIALAVTTVVFVAMGLGGAVHVWHGVAMMAALAAYIGWSLRRDTVSTGTSVAELHRREADELRQPPPDQPWLMAVLIIAGIAALVWGGNLVVAGASALARAAGISDGVIGLTIIAFGTSLPELAVSIVAALRNRFEVCVGNVIGSNIFNLFGVTGVATMIAPVPFTGQTAEFGLWALLAVTFGMLAAMLTGRIVSRIEGGLVLLLYCGYFVFQFLPTP